MACNSSHYLPMKAAPHKEPGDLVDPLQFGMLPFFCALQHPSYPSISYDSSLRPRGRSKPICSHDRKLNSTYFLVQVTVQFLCFRHGPEGGEIQNVFFLIHVRVIVLRDIFKNLLDRYAKLTGKSFEFDS